MFQPAILVDPGVFQRGELHVPEKQGKLQLMPASRDSTFFEVESIYFIKYMVQVICMIYNHTKTIA